MRGSKVLSIDEPQKKLRRPRNNMRINFKGKRSLLKISSRRSLIN
jgi:hypothetical protein